MDNRIKAAVLGVATMSLGSIFYYGIGRPKNQKLIQIGNLSVE